MGKLIPVILAIFGLGGGIGAGILARPDHNAIAEIDLCGAEPDNYEESVDLELEEADVVYVKLNNQFVIPVVLKGSVISLVVLSLTLEVSANNQDKVYQHEPKLRDAFLQVLFEHANAGGFEGSFTSGKNMSLLRNALLETAIKTFGKRVRDVLIVDLVRQDV